MIRDLAALLAVILAALVCFAPPLPWLRGGMLYVSHQGNDWNSGGSPEKAVATIQRAADLVGPGGTVTILPGVYRETVRIRRGGKAGSPVVFKALHPGTVTISGAAPPEVVDRLRWRDEGDRIWSAATPWPVYHVIGDGRNFYHVRWSNGSGDNVYHWVGENGRVEILRTLMNRPVPWGAFTYEGGRLYAAFPDGRSPEVHELVVHREVPRPYASWSVRAANVWAEADHLRFEGLTFSLGVGSGLLLWNARDVIVSDCLFTGANFGIGSFPALREPDNLTVEHSLYHNYPQYSWSRGWLSPQEIYRHHTNSTLVSARGDGIIVRYNLVTHSGDGLELSTPDMDVTRGVQVYGNLLVRGTDDAIELDGFAKRVSMHHNIVYDHPVSLGLSPVLAGPVLIRDNLFLHPPDGSIGAHFKLMNPWLGKKTQLSGPIRNIRVQGNLFQRKMLCFKSGIVEDVQVRGNLFADVELGDFGWPPGVTDSDNAFLNPAGPLAGREIYCRWRKTVDLSRKAVPHGLSESETYIPERPGPQWFAYKSSPSTRDIPEMDLSWRGAWQCD